MASIPLIDLSGIDLAGRAPDALLQQIDQAARHLGFMQIAGHGIPPTTLSGLTSAMDAFFALPPAVKQRLRAPSPDINRGYTSPLSERLSYSAGVVSAADLFEAFNVGASWREFPDLELDPVVYPENTWPSAMPGFQASVQAWFDAAAMLARRLTRLFAQALGLEPDHFEPFEDHSIDVLRLNRYAMPEGITQVLPDQMGMGAHTDYGIVTVLWADPGLPGLEVQTPEGNWIDVRPQDGTLLVNLGDLMARWTNDRWMSSLHRVRPPLGAQGELLRRRSAAFFHDGNADAVVECLPTCHNSAQPPRHGPTTVAEHLRRKLAGSRGLELNPMAQAEAARIRR